MNEIKKCPFCGNEPTIEQGNRNATPYLGNETIFSVTHELKCKSCGYSFGFKISEYKLDKFGQIETITDGHKQLVDRWNTRVEEPQEKKESNIEWALKKIEKGDFYFSICEIANYIKNRKPCAECDECEFQDDEDAINYLLAPHED